MREGNPKSDGVRKTDATAPSKAAETRAAPSEPARAKGPRIVVARGASTRKSPPGKQGRQDTAKAQSQPRSSIVSAARPSQRGGERIIRPKQPQQVVTSGHRSTPTVVGGEAAGRTAGGQSKPARKAVRSKGERDTSIETYRSKRDFTVTAEPAPAYPKPAKDAPMFVVQKHQAHRAGLHWDFRLEHGGVLWSWAVRKGPSLDPRDKRIAVHVEDHPIDYADFQGTIPDGQYGAGAVETWDRGTWRPLDDPEAGLRDGEIKFVLAGERLNGKFTLVRLRPRANQRSRQDNWLLIKGHDEEERAGQDAPSLEAQIPLSAHRPSKRTRKSTGQRGTAQADDDDPDGDPVPNSESERRSRAAAPPKAASGSQARGSDLHAEAAPVGDEAGPAARRSKRHGRSDRSPADGARRGALPEHQAPQLALVVDAPPDGDEWLNEIKFDGYRLLVSIDDGIARVTTRNGHDWTDRLPAVARAAVALDVHSALLDGELVALDKQGRSSFPALQAALSAGRDHTLAFYAFDLLHLDGWDLRPCPLLARKQVLADLDLGPSMIRYSDHQQGNAAGMLDEVRGMQLEGIICKQAAAPYRAGRGHGWLKVKCQGREELVVIGWTPPSGSRTGFGALHLGYYDPEGALHYAGGVGTGFSDNELATLSMRLEQLAADPPDDLLVAGDPLEPSIHWVRPELVAEIGFLSWSGAGRVRHAVYHGLREDKPAREVVLAAADPAAERRHEQPAAPRSGGRRQGPVIAVPPRLPALRAAAAKAPRGGIVTARAPKSGTARIEGVTLSHPDRELWPGITKQDLAAYWVAVADHALPGLAHRPLAILRCPEGIDGEHFFQKHGRGMLPDGIREAEADDAPYLAIDDLHGLVGMSQISAIELHAWGAAEVDPLHPDQLVFDLDPGDGVSFPQVVEAALEVRRRLEQLGLATFCRTTGGKGLHVVSPLKPEADWERAKPFCRTLAEDMARDAPDRFLSTVRKDDRQGRILIDWLRNGLGSTAVASFCPRARPGAGVATPLAWDEVTRSLDPSAFTLRTVPERLAKQRRDPWDGFEASRQALPNVTKSPRTDGGSAVKPASKARIVQARPPRRK
jgi:bifunctional non-homologous end joining protein LigD